MRQQITSHSKAYEEHLYAQHRTKRARGVGKGAAELFAQLKVQRVSTDALSLLALLQRDSGVGSGGGGGGGGGGSGSGGSGGGGGSSSGGGSGGQLCFDWERAANEAVENMFDHHTSVRKRHILEVERMEEEGDYLDDFDALTGAGGHPERLFEQWVQHQQQRMQGLVTLHPEGTLLQLFVVAHRTLSARWLVDRAPPFEEDVEDVFDFIGAHCQQLVAALTCAVITKALPVLKSRLPLARWCLYALDTLPADVSRQANLVLSEASGHEISSDDDEGYGADDFGLEEAVYAELRNAHALVTALIPFTGSAGGADECDDAVSEGEDCPSSEGEDDGGLVPYPVLERSHLRGSDGSCDSNGIAWQFTDY
jgi:hypothetical protein